MEIEIRKEKKTKINRIILTIGILCLIIGFSPWLFSYKVGLVVFVFCLVMVLAIKIAVIDAEVQPPDNENRPKSLDSNSEIKK